MDFGASDEELTAAQLVERQLAIEAEARRKFPWDPAECTLYLDIAPRQLLFACLTCAPASALCYACGLRCHADHNIVELYTKREFRCDCGTARLPGSRCCLRRTDDVDAAPNAHLAYGQNFAGRFCVCGESVADPDYGESAMIQCLLGTRCGEDWFHARCICGVSRAEERARQAQLDGAEDEDTENGGADDGGTGDENGAEHGNGAEDDTQDGVEDDAMSDDESDDMSAVFPQIPPSFGALVCPACLRDAPQLQQCGAVVASVNGYTFLAKNYAEIIAADPELRRLVVRYPFLGEREQSYRPQRDEDTTTLLEAGERALQGAVPHEKVVDGLSAFNNMQTQLIAYLRGIGSEERAVTKDDVESFFSSLKRAQ